MHAFEYPLLVGLLAASIAAPNPADAQQVTIAGVVTEGVRSTPIPNAIVRLSGFPFNFTDADGRFQFRRVMPGRYTLWIEAFGYRPSSVDLIVHADTLLQIRIDPDPVRLDSLVVSARTITISGRVHDAATGLKLLQGAQVTVYPGARIVDAVSGSFTLRAVPSGTRVGLLVEALEYLPARIDFDVQNDTTLAIALDVDSVGMRLVAQQAVRLQNRSMTVPHSTQAVNRQGIRESGASTIGELIRRLLPPGVIRERPPYETPELCIFLDDIRVGFEEVVYTPPEMTERIEIFGHRGRMIRVYTRRYVAGLMRVRTLPPIIYMDNGLRPACW